MQNTPTSVSGDRRKASDAYPARPAGTSRRSARRRTIHAHPSAVRQASSLAQYSTNVLAAPAAAFRENKW